MRSLVEHKSGEAYVVLVRRKVTHPPHRACGLANRHSKNKAMLFERTLGAQLRHSHFEVDVQRFVLELSSPGLDAVVDIGATLLDNTRNSLSMRRCTPHTVKYVLAAASTGVTLVQVSRRKCSVAQMGISGRSCRMQQSLQAHIADKSRSAQFVV